MDSNALDPDPPAAPENGEHSRTDGAPPDLESAYRQVQEHRLRYQELFDFAPDGYLVTDNFGVIREANHAAAALLNTRKEFLPGKPLPFYVRGEERGAFYRRLVGLHNRPGTVHTWEVCLAPPRADAVDVVLKVTTLDPARGPGGGLRWLLRDVTPDKRAAEALGEERNFSEVLVATAQVLILVVDADGFVLRANPFVSTLSGYKAGELYGRDWCAALLAAADRAGARDLVRRALSADAGESHVYELAPRQGRRHAIAWSAKLLGRPATRSAVLLTGLDVTELRNAQRLALQAERLAAIGQTMAGLAHEGRNALQRSLGCLERLSWALKDRPPELDLIRRIQRAQDDLTRLFQDVQGYAAPLRLEQAPCNLAEVWRAAWEELLPRRAGRDATLVEAVGPRADLGCTADSFRLVQVFRNILENALAACADAVRIEIDARGDVLDGQPAVRVAVHDNGPGLNEEQRRGIFEPFYTTKVKGTGLGMAIVKRIVEAHGGRIAVGDNPGPGAEIIVTLPRTGP
jgi:PAS domain S-box-containing protein